MNDIFYNVKSQTGLTDIFKPIFAAEIIYNPTSDD